MRCLVLRSLIFWLTMVPLTQAGLADALKATLSEGDVVPIFEARAANGMVWRSRIMWAENFSSSIFTRPISPADVLDRRVVFETR